MIRYLAWCYLIAGIYSIMEQMFIKHLLCAYNVHCEGGSHCPKRPYTLFVEKKCKQLNELKPKLNILSVRK